MRKITLLLAVCFVAMAPALAAQRVVVAEDITGTWCQYCPAAANGLDQLYNEVGDSLIALALHGGDVYETNETLSRISWYAIAGYPTVIFGGTEWVVGSDSAEAGANSYHYFRPIFDALKVQSTPVTMAMRFISLDFAARNGQAEIKAVNTGLDTVRATLQFVITERGIPVDWHGLHQVDFVVRDLVPDQNGQAVVVPPNDSITVLQSFIIDPSWVMGACRYAALLQQDDKTIIQGAQIWQYAPSLTQQRYTMSEVGDGDGYYEPGETGDVAVWVRNNHWAPGSGALARMTTDDPYVTVGNGLFPIGDMQPDDSTNNAGAPFTFAVLPSATMTEGHQVKLLIEKCIYSSEVSDTIRALDSVFVTVGSAPVIFADNFETGLGKWVIGRIGSDTSSLNWDTTSLDCHSPNTCVTDSRIGDYRNSTNHYVAMAESVDLTPFATVTISWWEHYTTQASSDYCRPQYTLNGTSWLSLGSAYSGTQAGWVKHAIDASAYNTSTKFRLRFLLSTNPSVTADGWYVDDVSIMGYTKTGVAGKPDAAATRGPAIAVNCYPNPTAGSAKFSYRLDRSGPVTLALYDISGRRVATIAAAQLVPAGEHTMRWNGTGTNGSRMASGIYIYRLTANGHTATGKLTLVR